MTTTTHLRVAERYVNRRLPALGKQFHAICDEHSWQGPWVDTPDAAHQQECPHDHRHSDSQ